MLGNVRDFADAALRASREFQSARHRYAISDWNGRVAVLKFFGDESFGGRHSGYQGCYAVAGYLADSEAWKLVTDDWHNALRADPAIQYFHMSECFAAMEGVQDEYGRRGQFVHFSSKQAKDKLNSLVSVVEKHGPSMASASSVITWDLFDHALSDLDPHFRFDLALRIFGWASSSISAGV